MHHSRRSTQSSLSLPKHKLPLAPSSPPFPALPSRAAATCSWSPPRREGIAGRSCEVGCLSEISRTVALCTEFPISDRRWVEFALGLAQFVVSHPIFLLIYRQFSVKNCLLALF